MRRTPLAVGGVKFLFYEEKHFDAIALTAFACYG
jgi:hypothetical protein